MPVQWTAQSIEWHHANLPGDMCIIASGGFAHFAEQLSWLMGYETLCLALYDQRDLVKAIADRLVAIYRVLWRGCWCLTGCRLCGAAMTWGFDRPID